MPKETLQNKQYFFNAGLITVIIGMYLLFAYLTYHSLQKYPDAAPTNCLQPAR